MRILKATPKERRLFSRVIGSMRKAGLRVPPCRLEIVAAHPRWDGWATKGCIHVVRSKLTAELLVHEASHLVADQITSDGAPPHNRIWAVVYGIGYQACIGR